MTLQPALAALLAVLLACAPQAAESTALQTAFNTTFCKAASGTFYPAPTYTLCNLVVPYVPLTGLTTYGAVAPCFSTPFTGASPTALLALINQARPRSPRRRRLTRGAQTVYGSGFNYGPSYALSSATSAALLTIVTSISNGSVTVPAAYAAASSTTPLGAFLTVLIPVGWFACTAPTVAAAAGGPACATDSDCSAVSGRPTCYTPLLYVTSSAAKAYTLASPSFLGLFVGGGTAVLALNATAQTGSFSTTLDWDSTLAVSCQMAGCTTTVGKADFGCSALNCTCGTPNFQSNATLNGCGAITGDYYSVGFKSTLGTGTALSTGLVTGGFAFACTSYASPCTVALGATGLATLPGLTATTGECIPSPTDYVLASVGFKTVVAVAASASFLGNYSLVLQSLSGAAAQVRYYPVPGIAMVTTVSFPTMSGSTYEASLGGPYSQASALVAKLLGSAGNSTALAAAFAANAYFASLGYAGVPSLLSLMQYSAGKLVIGVAPPPAPSPPPPYPPTPTPPPAATQLGKGADGYLGGCTFYADYNGNSALDAGEVFAVSNNVTGRYTLTTAPYATIRMLTGIGCVDTGTNLPVGVAMAAPAGYAVVSPLSAVASAILDANPGLATSVAVAATGSGLGLSTAAPLASYDFIAGSVLADAAYAADLAAVTKVSNLANCGAALLGTAGGPAMFSALAAGALGSTSALALDSGAAVGTLVASAAQLSGVTGLSVAQLAAVGAAAARLDSAVTAAVAAGGGYATLLQSLAVLSYVSQTTLTSQIALLAANSSYVADFTAATSASALAAAAAAANANWATINPNWATFLATARAAATPPPPSPPPPGAAGTGAKSAGEGLRPHSPWVLFGAGLLAALALRGGG